MYDELQETIMKENAAWIAARPDIPGKEDAMRNIELVANSLAVLSCLD